MPHLTAEMEQKSQVEVQAQRKNKAQIKKEGIKKENTTEDVEAYSKTGANSMAMSSSNIPTGMSKLYFQCISYAIVASFITSYVTIYYY